jgi:hypothetical protein
VQQDKRAGKIQTGCATPAKPITYVKARQRENVAISMGLFMQRDMTGDVTARCMGRGRVSEGSELQKNQGTIILFLHMCSD